MSSDSLDQYTQGRAGIFNDWHPPVMSFVWGLLDRVIPGPAGMLILQNLFFWSGIGLLVSDCFGHDYVAWLLILPIGLFPPIFALLGTIWKDVAMGTSLVFAAAMYLRAQSHARRDRLRSNCYNAAGLIASFYALTTRHDALPAVLPLVCWGAWILALNFRLKSSYSKNATVAIGIAACLILYMVAATMFVNRLLTGGRTMHASQQVMLHDLVGISVATNRVRLPSYENRGTRPLTVADLRNIYVPDDLQPLFWGDPQVARLSFSFEDEDYQSLRILWQKTVTANRKLYLAHRWNAFKGFLGIKKRENYPFHAGIDSNPYGWTLHRSRLNVWVMRRLDEIRNSILFRNWFYLALTLLIVTASMVALRKRNLIPVYALGCSGLFYTLHYFFVATVPDFRLNWWSVCATMLLLVFSFRAQSKFVPIAYDSDLVSVDCLRMDVQEDRQNPSGRLPYLVNMLYIVSDGECL